MKIPGGIPSVVLKHGICFLRLHLDENKAQSQTIRLVSKKEMPTGSVTHLHTCRCARMHRDLVLDLVAGQPLERRKEGTYRALNGWVCCINVQWANPVVSIWRPPTFLETKPKTEPRTQGGTALKPEIDDSLVCACARVCVKNTSCNLLYIFLNLCYVS